MIVAVNDGIPIMPFEIAFKSPIMSKAERDQCVCCLDRVERDDIPSIVWTADARERLTLNRVEIGKLNWIANPGFSFCR